MELREEHPPLARIRRRPPAAGVGALPTRQVRRRVAERVGGWPVRFVSRRDRFATVAEHGAQFAQQRGRGIEVPPAQGEVHPLHAGEVGGETVARRRGGLGDYGQQVVGRRQVAERHAQFSQPFDHHEVGGREAGGQRRPVPVAVPVRDNAPADDLPVRVQRPAPVAGGPPPLGRADVSLELRMEVVPDAFGHPSHPLPYPAVQPVQLLCPDQVDPPRFFPVTGRGVRARDPRRAGNGTATPRGHWRAERLS